MSNLPYRRIKKEFDIILDRYQNCSIEINNDNKYQNYIFVVKLKTKNWYQINLSKRISIKCPELYINEIPYRKMVCIGNDYILNELNKLNKQCLCYKSLICHNWVLP